MKLRVDLLRQICRLPHHGRLDTSVGSTDLVRRVWMWEVQEVVGRMLMVLGNLLLWGLDLLCQKEAILLRLPRVEVVLTVLNGTLEGNVVDGIALQSGVAISLNRLFTSTDGFSRMAIAMSARLLFVIVMHNRNANASVSE